MAGPWFTADIHFCHKNVILFDKRPFASLEEMHETIIQRWNETVQARDEVYYLGDLAYRAESLADVIRLRERLHGRIHMIWGNHDKKCAQRLYDQKKIHFESVHDFTEIKLYGQRITLCHYAMRVWPGSHKGAWHLYGHSHGKLGNHGASLDVGMPCWDYRPVSFAQIAERIENPELPRTYPFVKKFTGGYIQLADS